MKLTKYHKDAFVRAVMNDIPEVDYREQADKYIRDEMFKRLPEVIRNNFKEIEPHLQVVHISTPYGLRSTAVRGHFASYGFKEEPGHKEVIDNLAQKSREQVKQREELEVKLNAMIAPVSTLKRALEVLPTEFHKYLPSETEKTGTLMLPAITGMVESLQALGWPKSEPAATTA